MWSKTQANASIAAPDWETMACLAVKGLHTIYDAPAGLPHTARLAGAPPRLVGHNVRYALISLIGLAQARDVVGEQQRLSEELREKLVTALAEQPLGLGDWGLLLWARALNPSLWESTPRFAWERCTPSSIQERAAGCDSVELSWLSIGSTLHESEESERICQYAFDALAKLYRPATSLFARHSRCGFFDSVSGRVACFANQIYPLLALSYRAENGCEKSAAMAEALLAKLLSLQGPLGQWWWLYDSQTGEVVDRYPVFSVHQDGMAPMALMAAARALGQDLGEVVARTVRWIYGHNELDADMVVENHGLILRDIHPRGAGRLTRMAKSAAWCAGWQRRPDEQPGLLVINRECRPYHLGWVLYAAGLASKLAEQTEARMLRGVAV